VARTLVRGWMQTQLQAEILVRQEPRTKVRATDIPLKSILGSLVNSYPFSL